MEKGTARCEFNPENYGMMFCPSCYGAGKTSDNEAGETGCHLCRGFGWIRRESNPQTGMKRIPVRYGASSY